VEEPEQLAVEEIVAVVQRVNYSAMIIEEKPAQEDQHKTWHKKTSTKTWHQKTSTDLAQDAYQTEKKPPDSTMVGLTGGTDPGLNMGGKDPSQQEVGRAPSQHVGGRDPGLQVGRQSQCAHNWVKLILTPAIGGTGSASEDNDGGGEAQGHQENHHQDDAWREVLHKPERCYLNACTSHLYQTLVLPKLICTELICTTP
jgi:hypothetical protein